MHILSSTIPSSGKNQDLIVQQGYYSSSQDGSQRTSRRAITVLDAGQASIQINGKDNLRSGFRKKNCLGCNLYRPNREKSYESALNQLLKQHKLDVDKHKASVTDRFKNVYLSIETQKEQYCESNYSSAYEHSLSDDPLYQVNREDDKNTQNRATFTNLHQAGESKA